MAKRVDYERSDLSVRGAVLAVAVLSLAIIAIGFAVWLLERDFRGRPQPAAVNSGLIDMAPSVAPRLQISPPTDLVQLKAREAHVLGSFAWVNRSQGIARVPIERAMEALAERGWPNGPP